MTGNRKVVKIPENIMLPRKATVTSIRSKKEEPGRI